MRVLDLTQDFTVHTPAVAGFEGPSIKWVKRLAFDRVGGQQLTTNLHVGTTSSSAPRSSSGGSGRAGSLSSGTTS